MDYWKNLSRRTALEEFVIFMREWDSGTYSDEVAHIQLKLLSKQVVAQNLLRKRAAQEK